MYKTHYMWEQAIAVCKSNGTDKETCELAKKWAETLGAENGMNMLLKMNLVDAVIEYLMDRNEFDEAFKMANGNAKHKTADVHLKYALYLEDERRYKEAEDHFIKAENHLKPLTCNSIKLISIQPCRSPDNMSPNQCPKFS